MEIQQFGKEKPYEGSEDNLQIQTARWLRLQYPHVIAFHVPNGGKRPSTTIRRKGKIYQVNVTGAKLKRMGALAGVSDWLVLHPIGPYSGAIIELKVKGGTLQESQSDFLARCKVAGYWTAVCWSFDGFVEAIETYFKDPYK